MIQGGCPEGTGMGGPGYSIKGEFSRNGFKNELKHTKRCFINGKNYASRFSRKPILYNGSRCTTFRWINMLHLVKLIEGMEVADKIVSTKTDYNDKPYEDQVMKKVTVDTFGEKYDAPTIIED